MAFVTLMIIGVLLHPRTRNVLFKPMQSKALSAYAKPNGDAKELWRSREFASLGNIEQFHEWPENMITSTFPQLLEYTISKAVIYESDEIISIDVILDEEYVLDFSERIGVQPEMNSSTTFIRSDQEWIYGVFDRETAEFVNGYYSKEIEGDILWMHLGLVTKDVK